MRSHLAVLAALIAVVASCGASTEVAPTTAAGGAGTTAGTTVDTLGLTTGPSPFGEIVVDGDGYTLYLLVTDRQAQPTCVDDCTGVWAPHRAETLGSLGSGIDPAMVGTIDRDDGVLQTTYNGWPLYRYRDDGAPGDMNGHGQLNVFFALGPHGGTVGITE